MEPLAALAGGSLVAATQIAPYCRQHGATCRSILAALPDWFGIPAANDAYLRDLSDRPSWVALRDTAVVGAITLVQHPPVTFEIHFLAVAPSCHRCGVGRALVEHAATVARAGSARWLMAKTLAPSHPDPHYAQTRAFYAALGFSPLFESTVFWGPTNPAIVLVRPL